MFLIAEGLDMSVNFAGVLLTGITEVLRENKLVSVPIIVTRIPYVLARVRTPVSAVRGKA
jgi:hypothetical protein